MPQGGQKKNHSPVSRTAPIGKATPSRCHVIVFHPACIPVEFSPRILVRTESGDQRRTYNNLAVCRSLLQCVTSAIGSELFFSERALAVKSFFYCDYLALDLFIKSLFFSFFAIVIFCSTFVFCFNSFKGLLKCNKMCLEMFHE